MLDFSSSVGVVDVSALGTCSKLRSARHVLQLPKVEGLSALGAWAELTTLKQAAVDNLMQTKAAELGTL